MFGLGFEIPRCHLDQGQSSAESLPDYVIVPARCNNTELVLYTIIFQGILGNRTIHTANVLILTCRVLAKFHDTIGHRIVFIVFSLVYNVTMSFHIVLF